jgi:tRNA nucleotidyltransferase (CCA-adding enzyme)
MMDWNPDSLSQEKLHEYRRAAEAAWGDDTRHEKFIGHPQPSAGQCYVTSRWLTTHLGGHVGVKNGHYFWVAPDRSHVVDLTGDQFAYKPADLRFNGLKLDEEDEPWEHDPEKLTHRPGPVMFKRADHPLYKGHQIQSDPMPGQDRRDWLDRDRFTQPRAKLFADRANAALEGKLSKTADFGWGGDAYPGQEPQVVERIEHDRPFAEPEHYKWVYANGRLELDPDADYDSIADFVGATDNDNRPVALGRCDVRDGRATWEVSGNLGLAGLARVLHHHTRQAGWEWGGIKSGRGDRLAYTMWWGEDDGRLILSSSRLGGGRIDVIGKTAYVQGQPDAEAIQEWATDHKLALNTLIKTPEDIDGYNTYGPRPDYAQGPTDLTPPTGTLRCPECGTLFASFGQYILHRKQEEPVGDELDREDGHFPEMDQDKAIPPHFHEREPFTFPLAKTAHVMDAHEDGWGVWLGGQRFGAYLDGEQVGVMDVGNNGEVMHATVIRAPERTFVALVRSAALRHDALSYRGDEPRILYRLKRLGFVEQEPGVLKWSKGKEPMDMITDPIPFIFDVDKDSIQVGQPGGSPHHIMGEFTPGGIVQGFYEPGGVVVITNQTDYPWTVRHLVDLWYWSYPMMRVTDVQYEDPQGKRQKLAMTKTSVNVGQHVRNLATMDPAVWGAYQALKAAGGEVYAVGGVVRDALMGEDSNDIDLMVTGLHQDDVDQILKQLPGKVDLTGKSFGVFRYNYKGHEVEIALPRTEKSTGARRVDFDVNVDHTLPVEDDLLRRDFTGNSMAVGLDSGRLVDPFGGADDIRNGVLRTTHPSSFEEDPTRTLRALVMHGRYGWTPDERTRAEMADHSHRIHDEAWDNMRGIWDKLLKSKNPAAAIRLAQETGVLKHVLPELASSWDYDSRNPHHAYPLGTHHMHVLEGVQEQTDDPDLRFAALLHDIGKPSSRAMKCIDCTHVWDEQVMEAQGLDPFRCPKCGSTNTKGTFHGGDGVGMDHAPVGSAMAQRRLDHMKWPKARSKRIADLINHHMFSAFSSAKGARKFLNRVGEHADDLLILRHADMFGKGTDEAQHSKTPVDSMRRLVEQARQAPAPTALSGLAINGKDVLAAGIKPGPQVGQILEGLMQAVIENPELNTRESLLALVQESQSVGTQPATFT